MAGWKFTIIKNRCAQRCEVCHKSDQFDPATNICARCQPLPLDLLVNPIYTIPISRLATTVAAIFASCCFLSGFISLYSFFQPTRLSSWLVSSHSFVLALLCLNLLNLPLSLALHRWCSDDYNERLAYQVVVLGKFCAAVGMIGSLLGLLLLLRRFLIVN